MAEEFYLIESGTGQRHSIKSPCVIGRGQDVDISFDDFSVSHRHALIRETDSGVFIEDLGSRNGVFVNGKRIQGKALLKADDTIAIGRTNVLFMRQEEEAEQTVVLHSLGPDVEWVSDRPRLRLIHDIAAQLAVNQDIPTLGAKIFALIREVFRQDRGYLAVFEEDGFLRTVASVPPSESVPVSRSITGRLFRTGESLLLEDAMSDASFREQDSIVALKIRSALCAPLTYRKRIYGLIYIDRDQPSSFTHEDLALLKSVASIIAPLIENANLYQELKQAFYETVHALADTIEKRDPYTAGHTHRVMNYSVNTAMTMGLSEELIESVKLAAILHDIGKIGVNDDILLKEARLDENETEKMSCHTKYGAEILNHVKQLRDVIPGVRGHHEKYDGTGYPDRLSGKEIPLPARIIAVADTFDAMTTDRPYRRSLGIEKALDELRAHAGTQFDGDVVESFIRSLAETGKKISNLKNIS